MTFWTLATSKGVYFYPDTFEGRSAHVAHERLVHNGFTDYVDEHVTGEMFTRHGTGVPLTTFGRLA